MTPDDRAPDLPASGARSRPDFIHANTRLMTPPLVPEIRLHLAHEALPLWEKTEEELQQIGLPPPFWAFAWAGGQALARYILDNREICACRPVLDFASGSGLVAIAAALSGAERVTASDIDGFAEAAIRLNAAANNVQLEISGTDLIGRDFGWQVVLAGDIFYEKPLADRLLTWFRALKARGATVLIGDPGRTYLPKDALRECALYDVAVTRSLEDQDIKKTRVWRLED
jgi:predicted nicotinamide N-methyase